MRYPGLLILFICLSIFNDIKAQKYEFGIGGYATSYMGDLNNHNLFYYSNVGAGVFIKYNLNPIWAVKLNYNYLKLSGSDSDSKNTLQQVRNLSFNNNISEVTVLAEFNFLNLRNTNNSNRFSPFFMTGLGLIRHNPFTDYGKQKIYLRDLNLEMNKNGNSFYYSKYAMVLPVGLGLKYNLNTNWSIAAEINYRVAFNDYIDNVGDYYPIKINQNLLNIKITTENGIVRDFNTGDWYFLSDPSNNYAKNSGTLRGNRNNWDSYMTTGLTVSYKLLN